MWGGGGGGVSGGAQRGHSKKGQEEGLHTATNSQTEKTLYSSASKPRDHQTEENSRRKPQALLTESRLSSEHATLVTAGLPLRLYVHGVRKQSVRQRTQAIHLCKDTRDISPQPRSLGIVQVRQMGFLRLDGGGGGGVEVVFLCVVGVGGRGGSRGGLLLGEKTTHALISHTHTHIKFYPLIF